MAHSSRNIRVQWNLATRAASKRSNCKGPPGLPCAVTPQGTWPPCVPSNPSTIITVLRESVCPVVYSHKVGAPCSSTRADTRSSPIGRHSGSCPETGFEEIRPRAAVGNIAFPRKGLPGVLFPNKPLPAQSETFLFSWSEQSALLRWRTERPAARRKGEMVGSRNYARVNRMKW